MTEDVEHRDEILRRLAFITEQRRKGVHWHKIAQALGIGTHACQAWVRRHGDNLIARQSPRGQQAKERLCMTCREPFYSEGFHNRMCVVCRHNS